MEAISEQSKTELGTVLALTDVKGNDVSEDVLVEKITEQVLAFYDQKFKHL